MQCIGALRASDLAASEWELIVVDDGSDDEETSRVAMTADRVVALPSPPGGPAKARNAGVESAAAPIVAFVDADVLVHRDALTRIVAAFDDAGVAAIFGSYDDAPAAPGFVSQYRNLLHRYVHQRSGGNVESFWAGCGAIRTGAFKSVGGFDADRYRRPEMEDVELGYRLRDAGHRIVLDPGILCTHLKRWTLRSMIVGDFSRRGVPWARLLVERNMLLSPRGLSLGASERASAAFAVVAATSGIAAAIFSSSLAAGAAAIFAVLFVAANKSFLSFLARKRGVVFAAGAIPLHFIYSLTAIAGLVFGAVSALLRRPTVQERYTPRL